MINGITFRDMLISAANNIENKKQAINDLNVFPVPDGDTGTNMSLTMGYAKKELQNSNDNSIGNVSEKLASALLKGARGNSGVILSLLFRGFAKELKGLENANGEDITRALTSGVKAAYSAVMKPTEGTILTVARLSAEYGTEMAKKTSNIIEIFDEIKRSADETLQKTPDMLPVLKQANVVDAGGKGLVVIFDGMLSVLKENTIINLLDKAEATSQKANFASFNVEDIKFAYCTEFIIKKNIGAEGRNLEATLHKLGDSVVFVEDAEIIKIHVHTNNPGKVLESSIVFGSLINIKIDNMKEQHNGITEGTKEERTIAEPVNNFGFVVISAGDGLSAVFKDLGADSIVEGGQTMNPSTEDILAAIDLTPAKTVFVLPNNKNIILAAKQAVPLSDKNIVVIETKTIPQGISAMLEYNPETTTEENEKAMNEALLRVKTGQVTFAARDSVFDGQKITEGEILGLVENKVKIISKDIEECAVNLTTDLSKDGANFVSVFYGADISEEQANSLKEKLEPLVNCEINILRGGQPIYYYIISVE